LQDGFDQQISQIQDGFDQQIQDIKLSSDNMINELKVSNMKLKDTFNETMNTSINMNQSQKQS